MVESVNDEDVAAYQLLGWSSSSTDKNNDDNNSSDNDDEEWSKLHSSIRSTEDGVTKFRHAMHLLAGDDGRIIFADQEDNVHKDPMTIIKSYFRLIKCSLELPNNSTASTSLVSEDEWVKLASELLKRMTESLKNAMIQHQQELLNPSSSTSSSEVAASASKQFSLNININNNNKSQSQRTAIQQI